MQSYGTLSLLFVAAGIMGPALPADAEEPRSIYEIPVTTIDGAETTLKSYQGDVLLIVNVASRCGFTLQYEGLQKLHEKYAPRGLRVLGFPANNFRDQEPGTNEEIKAFCDARFGVTFPLFAKISVKGEDQHPLYRYLTSAETNPGSAGEIDWNFNKFLIGRDGKILNRFESRITPEDKTLIAAVEKALGQKKPTTN